VAGTLDYVGLRLQKFVAQLRHLPRAIAMVWKAAHRLTALWILLLVIQGLLPVATVYLTRAIVNQLVVAVRSNGNWSAVRHTLVLAAWIGAVMLATQLLRSATIWLRTAQSESVKDYVAGLIQQKSVEVDLAFYDSADFYDHLHRARTEAAHRPSALIEGIGTLLQSGITIAAMIAVLIPFGPILPLALLASAIPAFYVVIMAGQRRHTWNQRATVEERRSWYYDTLLTSGDSAAEIRLFGLGTYFRNAYQHVRRSLRHDRSSLARQEAFGELWAGLVALGLIGSTMAWMIWRAVLGLVSFGDLALFYQAFNQGLSLARTLLENIGQLYENTLFLGNLFEFLDLKPEVTTSPTPTTFPSKIAEGIQFENVTFRYPGSDRLALRNFSLDLKPNQIVALVGPNGAGKSTIIKLLCRFYDPDFGSISIDGIPLRKVPLDELRRHLAVHFQAPVQYNASANLNIRYGDIALPDEAAPSAVESAARTSGADEFIGMLPDGYDTQLGHWFATGSELSIGQWHRVGLARTFFRAAPIIILDEPTSAMDPWAEIEWAERFRKFAQDRIAIVITHRFTTAMFADVIHVVFDGRIVESGTHERLLAGNGLYAQGWAAQTRP
jgi:ATP-binding cassette subfamily B protein